jgi:hypothetical protein
MRQAKIFVSYRNIDPDRFLAQQVAAGLTPEDVIQQQLETSDFIISILSDAAAESDMVVAEVQTAHRLYTSAGRPVILVIRLNPTGPLRYPLSAYLNQLQHLSWHTGDDPSFAIQAIRQAISGRLDDRELHSDYGGLSSFKALLEGEEQMITAAAIIGSDCPASRGR